MRKYICIALLLAIILILWIIYFIQTYTNVMNEGFTPKINGMYRPYVRMINQNYETFVTNYGSDIIMNKLKKWNLY